MFNWILSFFQKPPPCQHKNFTERRWLDADNTPMIHFECTDCGWSDTGHVYTDPSTWIGTNHDR